MNEFEKIFLKLSKKFSKELMKQHHMPYLILKIKLSELILQIGQCVEDLKILRKQKFMPNQLS